MPSTKGSAREGHAAGFVGGKKRQRPSEVRSDGGAGGNAGGFDGGAKGSDEASSGVGGKGDRGSISSRPPPRRWIVIGKGDDEANAPVVPSPVPDDEFDEMVRSCVRNDAIDKLKEQRAVLAKRLHVSLSFLKFG